MVVSTRGGHVPDYRPGNTSPIIAKQMVAWGQKVLDIGRGGLSAVNLEALLVDISINQ